MLPSRREDPFLFWGYIALALIVVGGVIAVILVRGPLWGLLLAAGFAWALAPLSK